MTTKERLAELENKFLPEHTLHHVIAVSPAYRQLAIDQQAEIDWLITVCDRLIGAGDFTDNEELVKVVSAGLKTLKGQS